MKYLKLFEGFEDIKEVVMSKTHIDEICKQYNIINYVVNSDGSIDVNSFVNIWNRKLTKWPLKFNKVNDNFLCSINQLTSLEGCPKEVNGSFWCSNNELTSFEFAPKIIRANFDCDNNYIKTFEYFPSFVKGYFYCKFNPIYEVWKLFENKDKIELLNDFDIFRDEDTETPGILMNRLNDFLLTIGKDPVEKVYGYKNI